MSGLRNVVVTLLLLWTNSCLSLSVSDQTVEYKRNPLGIDTTQPRMSWQLKSSDQNTLQTSYRIRVALTPAFLDLVWDSGVVSSDQSLFIAYAGPALQSRQRYYWQVQLTDSHDKLSDWSVPAFWEMGLLNASEWQALWLTYPWQEEAGKSHPSPLLRREFVADQPIVSARLSITSLGLYQAEINGQRVGDQLFTPGWTAYQERLQYQVYDVSHLVREGANAIGVSLGDGWYRGRLLWGDVEDPALLPRELWGDRLALLAELHLSYADGSTQIIGSDEQWSAGTGPIQYSDIYNGELFDAGQQQPGWSSPDFQQDWQAAVLYTKATPRLVASYGPPVRAVEKLRARSVNRQPGGEWIVDFGQNLVGWARIQADGKAGQRLRLRHGELLSADGSLYRGNLRSALAQTEYLLDGQARHYEPNFSFQGFRYVEVTGYPGELTIEDIEAVVIHSAMPLTGYFETSNAAINQLQSNILWSQKGNFLDIPTDCPQRDERLGWTGDAQVFAPTAAYNMNVASFFHKWLADLSIDQKASGAVPAVVPDALARGPGVSNWQLTLLGLAGMDQQSATGWGDAVTMIPSALYERYGDLRFIENQYPAMRSYVDFMAEAAARQTWWWMDTDNWFDSEHRARESYLYRGSFTFGDWLAPECDITGCVPMSYVNTVFLAHSAKLLADAAVELDKTEDSDFYRELSDKVKAAFVTEYLAEGALTEDSQGALVLALAYNMLPREQRQPAADRLNQLVRDNGTRLATGFLSTPHLLPVLTRYGHLDTAYDLLLQQHYPSWLYTVERGATTMWERWNGIETDGSFGNEGMNSYNHYAYGAVGDWMYRTMAGIQPLSPGYKLFRVAPRPGADFEWVDASLETGYGRIQSSWKKTADGFQLQLRVPVNTNAQLVLPGEKPVLLGSGSYTLSW